MDIFNAYFNKIYIITKTLQYILKTTINIVKHAIGNILIIGAGISER